MLVADGPVDVVFSGLLASKETVPASMPESSDAMPDPGSDPVASVPAECSPIIGPTARRTGPLPVTAASSVPNE